MITYTGIDVGTHGAVVTIDQDAKITFKSRVPLMKGKIDREELFTMLRGLDGVIAIEEVHSIWGSSARSNFAFGYVKGFMHGALGDKSPLFIQPKTRQKGVWIEDDIVKIDKKKDTKATSLSAANRIFGVDNSYWIATPRSTKPHDGLVDAALIAYYLYTTQGKK